jgi:hypothetical protein
MIPLQIGLIVPEAELDYQNISLNLADNFIEPLEILHDIGRKIGNDSPIVAKVIFYVLAYFVYVIWVAAIVLILNLSRYGISWIYRRKKGKIKISGSYKKKKR